MYIWLVISFGFILEILLLYVIFDHLKSQNAQKLANTENKNVESNSPTYTSNDKHLIENTASSPASISQSVIEPTITPQPTLVIIPSSTPTISPELYVEKVISTDRGQFGVKMISIDSSKGVKMITDSASEASCRNNCPALSLEEYVKRNNGFAGINGTYFCPPDYPECKNKINSFDSAFYNSHSGNWVNSINNVYGCPGLSAETDGIHFNKNPYDFIDRISNLHMVNPYYTVSGGVFHCLKLVEDKKIVVDATKLSAKEKTKGTKSGIGINGKEIYLVVANNVNAEDFAEVFKSLGAQNAFGLDGGGSSALWHQGYKVGPGRKIPNAIVFAYDTDPSPTPINTTSQNTLYLLKDSFESDLFHSGYDSELGISTVIPSPVSIYVKLPSSMKITPVLNPQILNSAPGLPNAKLKILYSQNIVTRDGNEYIITVNTIRADANGQPKEHENCTYFNSGISCFRKTFQEANFVVNQALFRDGGYLYDSQGKFTVTFGLFVKKHYIWVAIVKNNPTKYFSDEEIKMWIGLFNQVDAGPIIK